MMSTDTDILIAGGGIAGLAAAARLGADGHRVMVAEPRAPGTINDKRTTALLTPAVETLERAGAWQAMAPGATALETMRLVDAGGAVRRPRTMADFVAREMRDGPFGWNVTNMAARAALDKRLAGMPQVARRAAAVADIVAREQDAVVRLSDGDVVSARLVIGADGRDSQVREATGIRSTRWSYGQRALVFAVAHEVPHKNVSTEIHSTGGPCTLVPMPDHGGSPASSVVWMVPSDRAAKLMALDDAALGLALTSETMGRFGPIRVVSGRAAWPMIGQIAHRMAAKRVALVAEAAHVIPPIGAQGLNMSLADVECLARLADGAPDPGAATLLAAYERRRLPETAARVAGIHGLNMAAKAEAQPLRDLRQLGLSAIHNLWPVRQLAMRLGLGG